MPTFSDHLEKYRPSKFDEACSAAAILRENIANRIHAGPALAELDGLITGVFDAARVGHRAAETVLENLRQHIAAHIPDDPQAAPALIGSTKVDGTSVRFAPPADPAAGGTNLYLHRPFPTLRSAIRRAFGSDDQNGTQALTVQFAA